MDIDKKIFDALGVPPELLTAADLFYSTAAVSLDVFSKKLEEMRKTIGTKFGITFQQVRDQQETIKWIDIEAKRILERAW